MKKIWKYQLDIATGFQKISTPSGARFEHVEARDGKILIWAIFEEESQQKKAERIFQVFGTGEYIPNNASYIGTVNASRMMWHIFELLT